MELVTVGWRKRPHQILDHRRIAGIVAAGIVATAAALTKMEQLVDAIGDFAECFGHLALDPQGALAFTFAAADRTRRATGFAAAIAGGRQIGARESHGASRHAREKSVLDRLHV